MSDIVKTLAETVRGRVITASDPDYDDARAVYNAMQDRKPRVVIQCMDSADVMAAVMAGRDTGLDLAIRGGGHSVPGFGTVDDGLVIDLSRMNNVRVDPVKKIARVGGGATWGDVDHATYPFGLAAPGGIISTFSAGRSLPTCRLSPRTGSGICSVYWSPAGTVHTRRPGKYSDHYATLPK